MRLLLLASCLITLNIWAGGPVTMITSAPDVTNDTTPTFEFVAEGDVVYVCAVDAAPLNPCTSPHTTPPLSDGIHTFWVQATSVEGISGPLAHHEFTIDTGVPSVDIAPSPVNPTYTSDSTPTFFFAVGADLTPVIAECRIHNLAILVPSVSDWEVCLSPYVVPAGIALVMDGEYIFEVRVTDAADNRDNDVFQFYLDTEAPMVTIPGPPVNPNVSNDNTPTFMFTLDAENPPFTAPVAIECAVDGGPFSPCTSPYQTPPLTEGPHTLYVQAIDEAGNSKPAAASHDFTIDTQPPSVLIAAPPINLSTTFDTLPTFQFTVNPDASPVTAECRIHNLAVSPPTVSEWEVCTSPYATPPEIALVVDGEYIFEVRVTDEAGNMGNDVFQFYQFTIDFGFE